MFRALHDLPDFAIVVLMLLTLVSAAFFAPVAGKRIFGRKQKADGEIEVFDAFNAVMSILGVLLAFSLVEVTSNQRDLQQQIGNEASSISDLDLILLRSGGVECTDIRPLLTAYAESRVRSEWPAMAENRRSPETDQAYDKLSTAIRFFRVHYQKMPDTYDQMVKLVDSISQARENIIDSASLALPTYFWITVFGLVLIALVLGSLNDDTLRRRMALGTTMAAVSMLLAYVVIVEMPLAGVTPLEPRAIEKALTIMKKRQPLPLMPAANMTGATAPSM